MPSEIWTKEKAWEWHKKMPWLRGCNYLPADCCNRIEFWQELNFEEHLATADRELALASSIGFNSVRMILEFIVWEKQHDGFMDRLERFLSVCARHRISVMICFTNDCTVPRDGKYRPPELGVQPCDWGYHGARKNSPHTGFSPDAIGWNPVLDVPETAEKFYSMVTEIIRKYACDERVCVWDLFNEPGHTNRGKISESHVRRLFETARAESPVQPLTTGVWNSLNNWNESEKTAVEFSDVISYHNYAKYISNILQIRELRCFGRPLLITEWLCRPVGNTIEEMFPLFFLEKIGCWNWGFVAGRTQTYEPWEGIWNGLEKGTLGNFDFTKWFHDLIRPSMRPYNPPEIEIIRSLCAKADEDRNKHIS